MALKAPLCAFLLSCVAVSHVAGTFASSSYSGRLDVISGVEFYWRISGTGAAERAHFALTAPTTSGWIGFGVPEMNSGSMPGADMAIATVAPDGGLTVGDYYALGYTMPVADCASTASDWTAMAATRNATHTVVEFSRLLAVTDAVEDRAIERGPNPTKFLVAYGTSATLSYHGRTARAMFAVDLFSTADPVAALRNNPNVISVDWRMNGLEVPAVDTVYTETDCVSLGTNANRQIVGFEVIVDPPSMRPYLHHMVVQAFNRADCVGTRADLFAVASAHVPLVMPDDVGLGLDFSSYNVQIHYDNPNLDAGLVDRSGVRVYLTTVPRVHEAGMLVAGDPLIRTSAPLSPGYTTIDYDCPADCTQLWNSEVTVFAELLHMHQVGNQMQTSFIAPDKSTVIAQSTAEWYQFHTQQNMLTERITLPRGSEIRTRCVFNVPAGSSSVSFGLGSTQEMCMHFIYYYPRQTAYTGKFCGVGVCGSQLNGFTEQTPPQRQFDGSCAAGAAAPPPAIGVATSAPPGSPTGSVTFPTMPPPPTSAAAGRLSASWLVVLVPLLTSVVMMSLLP